MATIIANPIYDSVFKFLMEDKRAAMIILTDLLQREVVDVEIKNNEYTKKLNSEITVLRIDFSAKVKDNKGNIENVNIELQKAWLTTEIMRFRKYLAQQYQSDNNRFIIQDKPMQEKSLHMVNIYLLGHNVENLSLPVTYVYPRLFDQFGTPINNEIRNIDFINELVHDMIIVQIPKISKMSVKTRLDKLLTLFDQAQRWENDHQLKVDETTYADEHKHVLNRLIYAKADEEICKDMDFEDEFQTILERWEQNETNMKEQLASKDKLLEKQNEQLSEQKTMLRNSILLLKSTNMTNEEIAQKLNIAIDKIEELL